MLYTVFPRKSAPLFEKIMYERPLRMSNPYNPGRGADSKPLYYLKRGAYSRPN